MLIRLGLFLLTFQSFAEKDVFSFRDANGFDKCMRVEYMVDRVKSEKGSHERPLERLEIQERCVEQAVAALAKEKNPKIFLEFVRITKATSGFEMALPIVQKLVGVSLSSCNEMAVYEVFLRSLAAPRGSDASPREAFTSTRKIVKVCLKDKAFRADFLEEKDNSDPHTKANACEILLGEKLVKNCTKG